MNTIFKNPREFDRQWFIVDAEGKTLGKLAVAIANLLRGKSKPYFTPHQECGDYVIVVNAEKIVVSGNKLRDKKYYRHSGYVGSLKEQSLQQLLSKKPTAVIELAVKRMLPKNRMGRKIFTNLKVYAGSEHPHTAQKPSVCEI